MKKKDIIIVVVALVAIAVSVFFVLRMLFPPVDNSQIITESDNIPEVPEEIDEKTYGVVESLSDYGSVSMEGIGKSDLFSDF